MKVSCETTDFFVSGFTPPKYEFKIRFQYILVKGNLILQNWLKTDYKPILHAIFKQPLSHVRFSPDQIWLTR